MREAHHAGFDENPVLAEEENTVCHLTSGSPLFQSIYVESSITHNAGCTPKMVQKGPFLVGGGGFVHSCRFQQL